jgi:hypothetical protein
MLSLLVTYAIAWIAVCAYASWMAIGNSRLARRMKRVNNFASGESDDVARSKRVV